MQKAMSSAGGGLSPDQEGDLKKALTSQYDELGGAYNNAIDAAPKFAKVPLGTKGVSDIISKHIPVSSRSSASPTAIAEGATGTYNGKSVVRKGGKWQYA